MLRYIKSTEDSRLLFILQGILLCAHENRKRGLSQKYKHYTLYIVNVLSRLSGYLPRVRKTHHTETINSTYSNSTVQYS